MDATTSNRLARGLLAASQGVNQMIQMRMQLADRMFKEKLANMQMQQHEEDRKDTMDLKRQSLQAQIDSRKQAAQDREDRLAWQKQSTADSQAMRQQSITNAMEASKERLAMMQSDLDMKKQLALERKDQLGADGLKNQFAQLTAAQHRLDNLVSQQKSLSEQYAAAGKNLDTATMAKIGPQLQSMQESISQYSQGLDAMGAAIGQKTGLKMPTTQLPKAAPVKEGGQYIKLRDGTYAPYDPNNIPEGLNPHKVPIGTPRSAIQPGGIYTYTNPGTHLPNGAVVTDQSQQSQPAPPQPPQPFQPPGE